jgi:hypothetical protein
MLDDELIEMHSRQKPKLSLQLICMELRRALGSAGIENQGAFKDYYRYATTQSSIDTPIAFATNQTRRHAPRRARFANRDTRLLQCSQDGAISSRSFYFRR